MILGGDPYDAPGNNLRVSLHHNWFAERCDQRMPSGSYSNAHVYNNYFSSTGNSYSTNARIGTHWLVQNNYYNGVNNPCNYQDGGIMQISGNTYSNCTGNQFTASSGTVTVPYSYSLTSTSSVPGVVQSGAGNITAAPGSRSAFSTIQAESYNSMLGVQTETCSEGGLDVSYIDNSDWIRFAAVNFGTGATGVSARVASNTSGGTIKFRIDAAGGTQIGAINVANTGGWQNWTTLTGSVSGVSGVHDLYLSFSGGTGYLFNLNHFVFTGGSARLAVSESKESTAEKNFQLFPNPASDFLIIETSQYKNATMLMYDNIGRIVLASKLSGIKTTVGVGGFSPGIYILKIYIGQEIITRKFLKK